MAGQKTESRVAKPQSSISLAGTRVGVVLAQVYFAEHEGRALVDQE